MGDDRDLGLGAHRGYSTVDDRVDALLGVAPHLTFPELAAKAGVALEIAHRFWRTLGLPVPDDDEVAFTEWDVAMLSETEAISAYGVLSDQTKQSVLRAVAHTAERVAWWELEALVDDAARRYELDDASARLVVLDHVGEFADIFQEQAVYVWRRHLANIIHRFGTEVYESASGAQGALSLPLSRSVGFADLAGFTELTADLGATDLANVIQQFEWTVRDVVAMGGGRVIKTIGDAVMYVADDAVRGAGIALKLAEEIGSDGMLPGVRVGMVWGRVLARFGDIFGPPVNLASRLTRQAEPGQVLIDHATADELSDEGEFSLTALAERDIPGIGRLSPVCLASVIG